MLLLLYASVITAFLLRIVAAKFRYDTRFPNVTWDNDNWVLSTTVFEPGHYQSRMSSANGYLGISVAAAGPFFEYDIPVDGDNISGWPIFNRRQTFATISGFFDEQPTTDGTNFPWLEALGGESAISGIPHWGGLLLVLDNGAVLNASYDPLAIYNFSSSLDFKRGISTWQYVWVPNDVLGPNFTIQYTLFTNKLFANQAVVQLQVEPSFDCNVSIVNILDGRNAVRTEFVDSGVDGDLIYSAVRPIGVPNVTAFLYAGMQADPEFNVSTLRLISDQPYLGVNDSSIAQAATFDLKAGQITTVTKFVGAASSDGFTDPQGQAKNASLKAMDLGYDQSLIFHAAEWAIVMPTESVDSYAYPENGTLPADENIIEAAIMAVVNSYYLLMNTVSQDAIANVTNAPIDINSISVCGLSSDCYAGQVFWDAEVWMQPGLVVAFPQAAKQIANYRVAKYGQAIANAKTAYTSSKNSTIFSEDAAVYPWTSGRYGNCTGTGPCFDYEYHINTDIVTEFINYWVASGDTDFFREYLFPIVGSISALFSDLLVQNGTQFALTNMTDPDEYANNVNNGGFTMASISNTLANYNNFRELFNMTRNATYDAQAANVLISRDPSTDITLEYTSMNGSISVKQADVVLNTFPLNYQSNYTQAEMLQDLDYYAGKQSDNGPGMTFAIFSIAAEQVSPSGCASYTYQQYSTRPYARAPWFQFSEQLLDDYALNGGTHPAFPFLTGHGGAMQVTVFGYLGLRLAPDFTLHLNPSLPPQIPHLAYRTFYWHGWPLRAVANRSHTTLTRLPAPYMNANMAFAHAAIRVEAGGPDTPAVYQLPPNGTITLPNKAYAATVPGNIAQCLPASSPSSWEPGQFPLSALDGAASTKWQPSRAAVPQAMTVDLSSVTFQPVTALVFDWAQNPPVNATVTFHNATEAAEGDRRVVVANITVSEPFEAGQANEIRPYQSNTTRVAVGEGLWSGRFATLVVQGNQGDPRENATGASVAEWAIVGEGGGVVGRREEMSSV
ncbi:hypothetical protein MMC13_006385 [Lambiella insularis]|nr:hypothetical protein [Lambiella insularis]